MAKFEYLVTKEDEKEGVPIKGLLRRNFNFSSRLRAKLKYQHLVFLNGEDAPGWITPKAGDVITINLPEERSNFPPEDIPIDIVYEDDDLLILNKQPGIIVHPTNGHPVHTIANGVMKYMIDTNQSFKIRFVNRLDMDTTGLLIVAKNSYSQEKLTKQMKANTIQKRYKAIVDGIVETDEFTINLPIGRPSLEQVQREVMTEGGYPSVTHVKVLDRFHRGNGFSLIELLLETGRTHQIRVHMSHIGHPVTGDNLYGREVPYLIERQALHAYRLDFNHPVTNERISVEAALPKDMNNLIKKIGDK